MWLLRKLLLSSRGSPRRNQPPGRGSGAWWGYLLPLKHLQACPSAGTLWCTPFGTADTIQCVERYPSGFFHRSSGRGSSGAPTWWCRGTDRASPTPPDGCPHRWRSRSSSSVPAPPIDGHLDGSGSGSVRGFVRWSRWNGQRGVILHGWYCRRRTVHRWRRTVHRGRCSFVGHFAESITQCPMFIDAQRPNLKVLLTLLSLGFVVRWLAFSVKGCGFNSERFSTLLLFWVVQRK